MLKVKPTGVTIYSQNPLQHTNNLAPYVENLLKGEFYISNLSLFNVLYICFILITEIII